MQKENHKYEQARQTLTESIESTCVESPPKQEILLADKLSTDRCRRDDRAAKLVILFPVRSSLSKFMHSPMQPRSCIPAKGVINYSTRGGETPSESLPWPRNFRNSMDSKSNSPVRDLSRAEVTLSQSPSGRDSGIKAEQSGADFPSL